MCAAATCRFDALSRGQRIVRLQSIQDKGEPGGYPDCCAAPNDRGRACSVSHQPVRPKPAKVAAARARNWHRFYCGSGSDEGLDSVDCEPPRAAARGVTLRCFTSEDSNFSLRASMYDVHWAVNDNFFHNNDTLTSRFNAHPNDNGALEVAFIYANWFKYRLPICLSVRGAFHHGGYAPSERPTSVV